MKLDRSRFRRTVWTELYNVRKYRQALRKSDALADDERLRMTAWVKVADEMLSILKSEPDGKSKAAFIDELYGLHRRPRGSVRYVFARAVLEYNMSESGLDRWQDNAVFIACILAVKHGAIDLSSDA